MTKNEYLEKHSALCIDIACASSKSDAQRADEALKALEAAYRFITQQPQSGPTTKSESRRYNAITSMIRKVLWGAS